MQRRRRIGNLGTSFCWVDSLSTSSFILSSPKKKKKKKNHQPSQAEVYGALCLAYFAFNYFLGRRRNSRLAGEVAEALRPLLESQFSHVGAGPVPKSVGDGAAAPSRSGKAAPQLLLRESPHEFVLWASGRRNLGEAPAAGSGALLRLRLRPRQDAVSTVLAVAEGLPDQLEVTLPLPHGDGAGVPVALAVGRPAALKEAVEDFEDLRRLAKAVPPGGAPVKNLPWWPTAAAIDPDAPPAVAAAAAGTNTGGLAAVSDSAQALADVVAAGPMGPALAASARASLAAASGRAVLAPRPRLRLLRLSGDGCLRTRGAGSPILTAVVDLPALGAGDAEGMADVARLVAAVLATADAVAVYGGRAAAGTPAGGRVMTADARSKALALRAAAAAAAAAGEDAAAGSGGEGGGGAGSSASSSAAAARKLEAKRLAAKEAEKAKLASMSSEAREKYLLKKQRIEQKRLMKRRTVRG